MSDYTLFTAEDAERLRRRDPDWLIAQMEDLADAVSTALKPSKARTAEAIRNIARGIEWRLGKMP